MCAVLFYFLPLVLPLPWLRDGTLMTTVAVGQSSARVCVEIVSLAGPVKEWLWTGVKAFTKDGDVAREPPIGLLSRNNDASLETDVVGFFSLSSSARPRRKRALTGFT